jgi:ATP-dependent RNA helicase RhlE
MQFQDLKLMDALLRAVHAEGYTNPTPIQVQAIPYVLDNRDIIGCAQTGTGKTAAFALPIIQRLTESDTKNNKHKRIRALVLSPTRELATQIGENFANYARFTNIKHHTIYGGVSQNPQAKAMRRGVDVVVATPGRLLDLIRQNIVRLNALEILVLDEADQMLDMGFITDVRKIIENIHHPHQTLMFSATMPPAIQSLADAILNNPAEVSVAPQSTTVEKIEQSVFYVEKQDKRALLEHLLQQDQTIQRVLVFTRTKHGANKLAQQLAQSKIRVEAIHGDKSQAAREKSLSMFKAGKVRVLIATDIASRGIDVDNVTHVINYDLPNIPESYVHRIGRTARAGAEGIAYSFCDVQERRFLRDIEKLIRLTVPAIQDHPFASPLSDPAPEKKPYRRRRGGSSNRSASNTGGGEQRRDGQRRRNNKSGEQSRERSRSVSHA